MIQSLREFNLIIERKENDYYLGRSQYHFTLKFKLKNKMNKFRRGDLVALKKREIDIV